MIETEDEYMAKHNALCDSLMAEDEREYASVSDISDYMPPDISEVNSTPDMSTPAGMIILPSNFLSISESAQIIFPLISKKHDMFYRGGQVHEATKDGTLCAVDDAQFCSRIESYGTVFSHRASKEGPVLSQTTCKRETARLLMRTKIAADILPAIKVVSRLPVIAEINGQIQILEHGYHEENGGIYITSNKKIPTVDINEALTAIDNLHQDFDFKTPADKSRAFAMLITPALKMGGFFASPTPIDIAEANASQSGKTERQRICQWIYGAKAAVITQKTGGVGSLDESIGSALIKGQSFIEFDNFRGQINSVYLESILTNTGLVSIRVPHQGEALVNATAISFQMSSNGVSLTRDLANRACLIRIVKHAREYDWHQWPEGTFKDHVVTNQSYYLGCVYSVIAEWYRLGRPLSSEGRHDMTEWAQKLGGIIKHVFKGAPLLDNLHDIQCQVSDPKTVWLREVCLVAEKSGDLNKALTAINIAELCESSEVDYPNQRDYRDNADAARYIGTVFSRLYKGVEHDSLEVDGFLINRSISKVKYDNYRVSKDVKSYTISLLNITVKNNPNTDNLEVGF